MFPTLTSDCKCCHLFYKGAVNAALASQALQKSRLLGDDVNSGDIESRKWRQKRTSGGFGSVGILIAVGSVQSYTSERFNS